LPHPKLEISIIEFNSDGALQATAPPPASAEVHVWEFPLTVAESARAEYEGILSSDEREKAARFHFEKDRRKFTVARASMRIILGSYLRLTAPEISFAYSENGKPKLAEAASSIRFNLSHSGEMALLGVTLGRDVGIDIELIRSDVETDNLARRFFSSRERDSIRGLPDGERISAFFRCWTCKEAFLKAQGVGLSRSLDSFDVEVNPKLSARLLATRPDASEVDHWFLHDVEVVSNYSAALAIEGSICAMKVLRSA
jgi:4'-phosphopantetheinyl transferase